MIINTAEMNPAKLSPDETRWVYNGLDCCVTGAIFDNMSGLIDDTTRKTYEFSKALQAPVLEMNLTGLLVNQRRKFEVVKEMKAKLAQLEEQLRYLVAEGVGIKDFNWRSPVQMKNLLYDVMQLPVQRKRNSAGKFAPTADESALNMLANYFIAEPICNHVLALRSLGKSLGFLETNIDPDGRMRTEFRIAGTDTGRFASSVTDYGTGTNLQNVTSSLRSIFVADPGMKFANLDLEQADSRNVGALCWNLLYGTWSERGAGSYLDACESGDLHTLVTKMSNTELPWGTAPDRKVADEIAYKHLSHRDLSKKLGHGSNYLGTPPTMAKHSRLPLAMVKEFHKNYFGAFPCIPEWHQSVFHALKTVGFLESPFGRRRFFFGRPTEGATRRAAVAHTPQSMTGDEINEGILRLWRAKRVTLLVQVHDSILFQYPEEQEDEIVPWAMETLQTHLRLAGGRDFVVPTDAATGWNWGYEGPDNPDGLKGWKGHDARTRTDTDFKLSIRGL